MCSTDDNDALLMHADDNQVDVADTDCSRYDSATHINADGPSSPVCAPVVPTCLRLRPYSSTLFDHIEGGGDNDNDSDNVQAGLNDRTANHKRSRTVNEKWEQWPDKPITAFSTAAHDYNTPPTTTHFVITIDVTDAPT